MFVFGACSAERMFSSNPVRAEHLLMFGEQCSGPTLFFFHEGNLCAGVAFGHTLVFFLRVHSVRNYNAMSMFLIISGRQGRLIGSLAY